MRLCILGAGGKCGRALVRAAPARGHDVTAVGTKRELPTCRTLASLSRALVRAIVQARRWHEQSASGEVTSIEALAQREDACPIYLGQLLPLASLAPDLVEAILDGRQPPRRSLVALIKAGLPMRWSEQRAHFSCFH